MATSQVAAFVGLKPPTKALPSTRAATDANSAFRAAVAPAVANNRKNVVRCEYGDVVGGTNYLVAGAAAIAVLGTALPIIFFRKDTCPECGGAGFVRAGDGRLNVNAATKAKEIVCPTCNGLGKLNQTDKSEKRYKAGRK